MQHKQHIQRKWYVSIHTMYIHAHVYFNLSRWQSSNGAPLQSGLWPSKNWLHYHSFSPSPHALFRDIVLYDYLFHAHLFTFTNLSIIEILKRVTHMHATDNAFTKLRCVVHAQSNSVSIICLKYWKHILTLFYVYKLSRYIHRKNTLPS